MLQECEGKGVASSWRLEITQHLPATPELGKHIFIQSGGNSKPLRGISYVASQEHVFFEPVLIEEDEEDVSPKEKGSDTNEEEMLEFIEEDEEDVNPKEKGKWGIPMNFSSSSSFVSLLFSLGLTSSSSSSSINTSLKKHAPH